MKKENNTIHLIITIKKRKFYQEQVDVLRTIQKPGTLLQVKPVNLLPFNVF